MIFSWLRRRRRRRILQTGFPTTWEEVLRQRVRHFGSLDDTQRQDLRQRVQIVVAEKNWEGCGGFRITDEVKVTIAGHACLLVLGFPEEYFDRLLSILVYPDTYVVEDRFHGPAGVVTEMPVPRLGETWYSGPVILSWKSVREAGRNGQNVVLHEFAHYLDMQSEDFDGTPLLGDSVQYHTWQEVMAAEHERLMRQADSGRRTLLDHYGATNAAEFFAVATECFFERPSEMRRQLPRLYAVLEGYYRQSPAERWRD